MLLTHVLRLSSCMRWQPPVNSNTEACRACMYQAQACPSWRSTNVKRALSVPHSPLSAPRSSKMRQAASSGDNSGACGCPACVVISHLQRVRCAWRAAVRRGAGREGIGLWFLLTRSRSAAARLLRSPCAAAGHHPPRSNGHHNNTQELLDILEPILEVVPRPITFSCEAPAVRPYGLDFTCA